MFMDGGQVHRYNNTIQHNTTSRHGLKWRTGDNMTAIKVNGINYTMTREGYYYKAENGKQKRIPKAEWELSLIHI